MQADVSLNVVDRQVGSQLRLRRLALGMTQQRLGKELGVTFQQVQKYEKGTNRVSASRLQMAADLLGVSPSYFFEGLASEAASTDVVGIQRRNPHFKKQLLELNRAFNRIASDELRQRIAVLVKVLADNAEP